MKKINNLWLVAALLLVLSVGCTNSTPQPKSDAGETPTLAADAVHPVVDDICSDMVSYQLVDETGNTTVQYCGFIPCTGTQPEWGTVTAFNNPKFLFMNVNLAFGWYIKLNESFLGVESDITWNNGAPVSENNWFRSPVNPVVNAFQVKIPLDSITGCFNVVSKIVAVKLDFFAGEDANSTTNLWLRNSDWNNPDMPNMNTNNPMVCTWCFQPCGPTVVDVTGGECKRCDAEVTVTFVDCASVDISSCKDLSNVVLVYTDGTWEKFDGLSNPTGTFRPTGANMGKEISHVYVKSGCFKSGDGPGWGRRFDGPCSPNYVP